MSTSTSAKYAITQEIPVSDHVYKYLLHRFGSNRFTATRRDFIGAMILDHLGRTPDTPSRNTKSSPKTGFTKTIRVTISEELYTRSGILLSAGNAKKLHDKLDLMFREELFNHVIMNSHMRKDLFLQSMRRYLDFLDITEEDVKMESLYKDFKRRKKRLERV